MSEGVAPLRVAAALLVGLLSAAAALASPRCPLPGLAFGPYVGAQDPADGVVLPEAQIRERLALLRPWTRAIRSYGVTRGLEHTGRVAHELGLRAAIGAWLGRDRAANEAELASLIAAARAGEADVAIVGSEVLLRGDLSVEELVAALARVRVAIPADVPVTTAEIATSWHAHPELLAAVDLVYVHLHPYSAGHPIDEAVYHVHREWRALSVRAAPKPVVIAEFGWPSGGQTLGAAVPSKENAAATLVRFVSWAETQRADFFYFEAFDEPWKAALEGASGNDWGVAGARGEPKPGLERALRCERSNRPEPGFSRIPDATTPGAPSLAFDFVPPRGSHADLRGHARFVVPVDWSVAVLIDVGGWWTKPTFATPTLPLGPDGRFTVDVTTGANDASARRIAAFLVPWDFIPPPAAGLPEIPAEMQPAAPASLLVER